MREARISFRFLVHCVVVVAPVAAAVIACADTTPEIGSSADAGEPDAEGKATSTRPDDAGTDDRDSGPKTTCETSRAYYEGCGNEADLNCGTAGYDAWCAANDKTINSEAFRRAETRCLNGDNCDGADRRDCEYGHYADETPTSSQKALVKAYCQSCEPSDIAGCTKRSTTYDRKQGIKSVPDIFIAAWELADDLVDEIKTTCTGTAVDDAGVDPVACAEAFADCAGGIYLNRIPDCAK